MQPAYHAREHKAARHHQTLSIAISNVIREFGIQGIACPNVFKERGNLDRMSALGDGLLTSTGTEPGLVCPLSGTSPLSTRVGNPNRHVGHIKRFFARNAFGRWLV